MIIPTSAIGGFDLETWTSTGQNGAIEGEYSFRGGIVITVKGSSPRPVPPARLD
ncbi:hypothetical protein AB0P21_04200 [Kribbella sp. NPDC056861]|uniref:hypothetical protein n=1 Tax=Kribbella sp. NPDC056861 TaxID=3154857 RepID=UPI003425D879